MSTNDYNNNNSSDNKKPSTIFCHFYWKSVPRNKICSEMTSKRSPLAPSSIESATITPPEAIPVGSDQTFVSSWNGALRAICEGTVSDLFKNKNVINKRFIAR